MKAVLALLLAWPGAASGQVRLELPDAPGSILDQLRNVSPGKAPAASRRLVPGDLEKLRRLVRKNAKPFHWQEILSGASRVIYIGEAHPVISIRRELAARMRDVKEAGITHLGLEMLDLRKKAEIKQFCDRGLCREQLLKALTNEWGWAPASYMEILDAARAHGIAVLGLNAPVANASYSDCDSQMTASIDSALKEHPEARILVLAGVRHVVSDAQPELLKTKYGLEARTYSFLLPMPAHLPYHVGLHHALAAEGRDGARLLLSTSREEAKVDGIIVIPEVLEEAKKIPVVPSGPPEPVRLGRWL